MANSQDPFNIVKEEVVQSIQGLDHLYERWKELLWNSNTAKNQEFDFTMKELKSGIQTVEWDLSDLSDTIQSVEGNMHKYGITQQELQVRKKFVQTNQQKLKTMKDDLNSEDVKKKLSSDQRSTLMSENTGRNRREDKLIKAIEEDNDQFIDNQLQQHQVIMNNQDEKVGRLGNTVSDLKEIGREMSKTLKKHEDMIHIIDEEVDANDRGIMSGIRKINRLMDKTSDRTQWIMIGILAVLLIILIVVIFYV